ncbi:MAG: exodeoxyribonuclease VII large subunit [Muribaculaceae bacterium]|nr:exodeoxyribonuclease VII large subunit [Muribaculaceae bacterium]
MAEALTLYQFTNLLTRHINAAPQLMGRWVVVEIARIGMSGPHCYCEFIEKDARGATIAKIKGTIWGNVWRRLSAKFYQATGRQIGAGMKVMFNMSASHSEAYGLSANVHDVDPAYTLGDAERRRREILEMLTREGLINSNRNLRLVYNPQKIAVISAAGAAGYGDFMHQIETSGFSFYPLLYPAAMQGVRTAESVIQALDRVEMAVDFWDCVIIIRGGGATDDLNSFDDPQLARRVAECPLPVIVGIGHERDRTVLDEIAHTRCKTPTAVAAFLIERLQACENHAVQLTQSVVDFTRNAIAGEERRLSHIGALLPLIAPRRLESEAHRLAELRSNIIRLTDTRTRGASQALTVLASRIIAVASDTILRQKERLTLTPRVMRSAVESRIMLETDRLVAKKNLVDVLSPTATLRRGYSITRVNGKAVRSVADVKPGDRIETTLADGTITGICEG